MTPYQKFTRRIQQIEDEASLAQDRALARLKKAQEVCPHTKSTFHADPAGDTSESYHKCDLCGKEF